MEAPDIRYTQAPDGIRLAYGLYTGEGEPIFSIHPPADVASLLLAHEIAPVAAHFDALNRGRPGVRMDYRGTGLSGPIAGTPTVEHVAADIEAVIDAVGGPLDVVAWCHASMAVAKLAVRRRELFRTVTLVNPDVRGSEAHYRGLWELRHTMSDYDWRVFNILGGDRFDVSSAEAGEIVGRFIELCPRVSVDAYIESACNADVSEDMRAMRVPTLVFGTPVARETAAHAAELIPGCSSVFYRNLEVDAAIGAAIREAMDKHLPLAGAVRAQPLASRNSNGGVLSDREWEVLDLIAEGHPNDEIAAQLTLSRRTVERHARNIYTKIDVSNRVEATRWAIDQRR